MSIFEGVNDYWRTENSNNYYKVPNPNFTDEFNKPEYDSDRDIYRVLGAKPDDLLLKVNIEVRLTPEHINKIETFLRENSQKNVTYDGNPNEQNTTNQFDRRKFPTRFFIGSLKGNERIRTHFTEIPYNLAPDIFARLGLKNQQAVNPFDMLKKDERKGLYFAQPYQMFAFEQGIENGVLCKNTFSHIAKKRALEHVTKWDHAPGVKDRKVGLGNHALSGGFFYDIRPRLKLSFKSATGETVHADAIAFHKNRTTKFRTTSMGTMPLEPPLQSVVTIDPTNGWHNDDRYLTSKTPGREYAQLPMEHMRTLIMNTMHPSGCEFTISYQTNFSIVTKVTKDLLSKTEKIDAKMFYHAIYPDIWVDIYKTIHIGTFYLDEQKSSVRIEYMRAGDNKI